MTPLTLGGWLRARRLALGLSVREVARRIGVAAPFLGCVEHGRRLLARDRWGAAAKALRCTVRELRLADEFTPCRHCGRTGPRP